MLEEHVVSSVIQVCITCPMHSKHVAVVRLMTSFGRALCEVASYDGRVTPVLRSSSAVVSLDVGCTIVMQYGPPAVYT